MDDRDKCFRQQAKLREAKTKQESINADKEQTMLRLCLCSVRVIIGTSLAICFISKDLVVIMLFEILRSATGTVWSLVTFTIESELQLATTFVRAVMRGVEDLLGTVSGIISRVVHNGCGTVMRRLYRLIGIFGFSSILLIFLATFIIRRIFSFFSDR